MLMGGLSIHHLAAIGVGSMIFNMVYWNFGFLRMGTTGMTAQAYGAGREVAASVIMARGLLLGMLIAICILLCSEPLLHASLYLFNVEGDSLSIVREYYEVRIWAAPATMTIYVLSGWLFGMQNALYPLAITVMLNIVNIVISYYCVAILGMEASGVAIGTVIAQYSGVLLGLGLIFYKYGNVFTNVKLSLVLQIQELRKFLKVNSDIFLRTLCLTFVFSFFYSQSFKLGAVVMAVNVILQQFINWMSYGIDGFAYASESLVGKYKGAKDDIGSHQIVNRSFVWGGVTALIFTLVFVLFDNQLMHLFSDDEEAIALAQELVIYVYLFPLLAFASYIWDGIFVGLLASKSMRNAMLFSLAIFLITFYMLPVIPDGSHIWIALCVFMVARGLSQTFLYKKYGMELS